MRLIDADTLEAKLEEQRKLYIDMDMKGAEHLLVHDVLHHVWEAPTIDAVPVVRCKDCKRRKSAAKNGRVYWNGYEYYCEIAHYGVLDDGFCFYGERKDDE